MPAIYRLIHPLWRMLPLDIETRQQIRQRLFRALPWLFGDHPAFQRLHAGAWSQFWAAGDDSGPAKASVRYVPRLKASPLRAPPARVLAFYLPQFHPIPENDAWWGTGFTEWTNVVRGVPRFPGHYQPHLPGELGFYDLRDGAVIHRQIELAKLYGIAGFVFYFYWFGGRRLLEAPLLTYLHDDRLDLPFCLCWANESWTRRWDGREQDVLLEQRHSPDDDLRFIAYIAKYLRDPRYLRVRGRPLLIVYRPELLPDPEATAKRWRSWCREHGIGDLYLAYTLSFESRTPTEYGMDAALEFPPNNSAAPEITAQVPQLDPAFRGKVFDWSVFPQRSREYAEPGFPLFRGVATTWDNEARRAGRGAVFAGASPEGYREWLENAVHDSVRRIEAPSERLIFINAWNEWAEGAHLEPDRRYGYAFLQATRDALERAACGPRRPILVVAHDAQSNGAQLLALNLARTLNHVFGYRVHVLLLGDGPLLAEFRRVARVWFVRNPARVAKAAHRTARLLRAEGIREAIVNSTASGQVVPPLRAAGLRVVSLVHELPGVISESGLVRHARMISEGSEAVVFPAERTVEGFRRFVSLPPGSAVVRPQGLYKRCRASAPRIETARRTLRARLGLDAHARIVLGVGYGDRRKGFDLFAEACCRACARLPEAVFVWVGEVDPTLAGQARRRADTAGCSARLVLAGYQAQTEEFYSGADVFAMTSREDPFPSVVLEALDAGLAVVAFDGGGGMSEIAGAAGLQLVPAFDIDAYFEAIASALLMDPLQKGRAAARAQSFVAREFGFRRYVWDLLALFPDSPPRVSAVVHHDGVREDLEERLDAILRQSMPVYELIVISHAATDLSDPRQDPLLRDLDPEVQLIGNTAPSDGGPRPLLDAIERARGDFVWIPDAGSLAEPGFLRSALCGAGRQEGGSGAARGASTTRCREPALARCPPIRTSRLREDDPGDPPPPNRSGTAAATPLLGVFPALGRRDELLRALRALASQPPVERYRAGSGRR